MSKKRFLSIIFLILIFVLFTRKKIYDINEYLLFTDDNHKTISKLIKKYFKNNVLKTLPNEPKVTVVTVVRNIISEGRKESLVRNFESVHNQNYGNIEHLVIDGASKDGTIELLEEYKNKDWIKYISEKDDGIYDAMNKGIDLSTGKYINFLNSDDYFMDDNAVLASVSAIEENKADFSFAANKTIGWKFIKDEIYSISEKEIISGLLFNHQTLFTTKESLLKLGKFNKIYKSGADLDFMLKLLANNYKFVNISPRVIISYNRNGFSSRHTQICKNDKIRSFENVYKNNVDLTTKQIYDLAVCHRLDEDVLSKLMDFYKERNPMLFEKSKDIFNYRLFYSYNLFGIIPIISSYIKGLTNNYKRQIKLFNFIPIIDKYLDTLCQETDTVIIDKVKLFNFIPIFSKISVNKEENNNKIVNSYKEFKLFNFILLSSTGESTKFDVGDVVFIEKIKLFNRFLFREKKISCSYKTNKCKKFVNYK